jgi:uncharacterized protein DUF1214
LFSLGTKNKTLKYNNDGSLTLYAGSKSPGTDKESNWLPAPEGPFSLYIRAYWADKAVLPSVPDSCPSKNAVKYPSAASAMGTIPRLQRFLWFGAFTSLLDLASNTGSRWGKPPGEMRQSARLGRLGGVK